MGCALPEMISIQETTQTVRVELSAETLNYLIMNDMLSVNSLRCLDCDTKRCVQQVCLKKCALTM